MGDFTKEGESHSGSLVVPVDSEVGRASLARAKDLRMFGGSGIEASFLPELAFAFGGGKEVKFVPTSISNGVCDRVRLELPNEQIGWFTPWMVQSLLEQLFGENKIRSEDARLWWSGDEEARKREPLEDQIGRALDEGREIVLKPVDVSESRIPA